MIKPDLMAELAGRFGFSISDEVPRVLSWSDGGCRVATDEEVAIWDAIQTHHAELEAVVRKAKRYDWIATQAEIVDEVDYWLPSVCRIDFKPGPELNAMHKSLDAAIDQAMHNSAREGL